MSTETQQARAETLKHHFGRLGLSAKPAFLALYAVAALALFGYAQKFVPASLLRYPFGLLFFLPPGAVLAAWIFRTSRGGFRFDWKWAFLSGVVALLLWEGVAKGAAWAVTQATGTPYDQAFPLERNVKPAPGKNFYRNDITGTKCLHRLQGKLLHDTLPQHLCLEGADYSKLADGVQDVRLKGRVGLLGRSIDGYELPARTSPSSGAD